MNDIIHLLDFYFEALRQQHKEICPHKCEHSPQETLYVWNEPKLCTKGVPLPPRSSSPCEAITMWLKVGVGGGAFMAALLISLTCYFWKKNKR